MTTFRDIMPSNIVYYIYYMLPEIDRCTRLWLMCQSVAYLANFETGLENFSFLPI